MNFKLVWLQTVPWHWLACFFAPFFRIAYRGKHSKNNKSHHRKETASKWQPQKLPSANTTKLCTTGATRTAALTHNVGFARGCRSFLNGWDGSSVQIRFRIGYTWTETSPRPRRSVVLQENTVICSCILASFCEPQTRHLTLPLHEVETRKQYLARTKKTNPLMMKKLILSNQQLSRSTRRGVAPLVDLIASSIVEVDPPQNFMVLVTYKHYYKSLFCSHLILKHRSGPDLPAQLRLPTPPLIQ